MENLLSVIDMIIGDVKRGREVKGESLSKEQMTTRDVFTGCADLVEEDEFEGSVGECIDKSIISEEEGDFGLTELGEKAMKRGRSFKVKVAGEVFRIDRTD